MSDFVTSVSIWLPGVLVMTLLVAMSGFFSASETALFFLSRDQIRRFSKETGRRRMVASLMADPDRLLTAVLFWNLLINLAYFSTGLIVMHRLSHGGFTRVAAVLGISNLVAMIVFGEVLPKSVAVAFRLRLAPLVSWPLAFAALVLDPVVPVMGRIAQSLRRAFWMHIEPEPHLHPDDLEQAVDNSAALGHDIQDIEQQVLHNVLDLSEIRVEEVMRPRSHLLIVEAGKGFDDVERPYHELDYLLLQEPDDDHVSRAVPLGGLSSWDGRPLRELAEGVIYVPWCASLAYTFSELQRRYCGVAVVVHEHGEMVGAVTFEDIVETMLTEFPSRTKRMFRREPVIAIGRDRYHADGLVTLRYLAYRLRIDFDPDEDGQYTINGLLQDELERIPEAGESLKWKGWRLTVIDVGERGQIRVLIEPLPTSVDGPGEVRE
ncbi:MAG: HlyC/CorC family transporter [Planctomycetaceae bacterium]|nr:HlyC/CorC family transporter [Planctomycetaceae bacterium]